MKYLALALTFLLISLPALAADPECSGPAYDPAEGPYDATTSIRFCTPEFDASDPPQAIPENGILGCTVTANGLVYKGTRLINPGEYIEWPVPQDVKDIAELGPFSVSCRNAVGDGALAVASSARFRPSTALGVPGVPTLLQ